MAIVYQHFAYENSIHHWGTYIISFFGGLNPQMRTNTGSSFKISPSFLLSSFLVFQFPNSLSQLLLGKIETGPLGIWWTKMLVSSASNFPLVFPQTKTWYNGSTTVLPSSAPVAGSPSAYKRHISWEKRWDPGRSLRSLRSLSRGGLVIPLLSWSTCWATYCDSWGCWYLKSWIYIYIERRKWRRDGITMLLPYACGHHPANGW